MRSTGRTFAYVLFRCMSVPMHHPTLFDSNLLLLCFLCGSMYWRCTGFWPNASKMNCDCHAWVGEDRFDERIGLFYRSLAGAYALFLISWISTDFNHAHKKCTISRELQVSLPLFSREVLPWVHGRARHQQGQVHSVAVYPGEPGAVKCLPE